MRSFDRAPERRHAYRVAVAGTAHLWRGERLAGQYELGDVSIGGCLLREGPPCGVGESYSLSLHLLDGRSLRLPARVVRLRFNDIDRCDLGLEFEAHPPATEDRIHDLVIDNLEHLAAHDYGRVLVAHGDGWARRALSDGLRRMGYEAVEAATPLEAVWELENGPMDIHTAIVSLELGNADGRDLARFLSERYPGIRRVLVGTALAAGDGAAADAVLSGPLDVGGLRKVIPVRRAS
jgi:CheY-like chemotaxis protein